MLILCGQEARMNTQIELYHNLTAFYLGPEQELRREIEELKQKITAGEQRSRETASREHRLGYERGRREGDKEGYERGYQESIENAEYIYALGIIKDEIEALNSLNLPRELHSQVFDICHRFHQSGWTAARKLYAVTYHCCTCHKIIELNTKNERKAATDYMEEHKWGHAACIKP